MTKKCSTLSYASSTVVLLSFVFLFLFYSESHAYEILTQWGDTLTCDYRTQGGFIVWWDDQYDHYDEAGIMLDELIDIQNVCLNDYEMDDTPNIKDGYYYNVYIHRSGDLYPDGWAMGQGTDNNRYPYLTIPSGLTGDMQGINHEGFHVFQYNATSDGFEYSGDSWWIVEGSANWFAAERYPDDGEAYVGASAIKHLPHLPMWTSYTNTGVSNWQRGMHGYGMNLFLNYLTLSAGEPGYAIAHGFYAGTDSLPQEYMYYVTVGADKMREYYADCMARLAAGYDYDFLSSNQASTAESHFSNYGDPNDDFEIVETYNNTGTGGSWHTPANDWVTRGWAFNVYEVDNSSEASYTFHLDGDAQGSDGTPAVFEGKVVVIDGNNRDYYDLTMTNDQDGSKTVNVSSSDEKICFVVISMPTHFRTNQTYSYKIKIDKGAVSINNANMTVFAGLHAIPLNTTVKQITATPIRYYVPEQTRVRLYVYSLDGRLIGIRELGEKPKGIHLYRFNDLDNVSRGIYLYRLAGDQ
jgi:hypothetical protein